MKSKRERPKRGIPPFLFARKGDSRRGSWADQPRQEFSGEGFLKKWPKNGIRWSNKRVLFHHKKYVDPRGPILARKEYLVKHNATVGHAWSKAYQVFAGKFETEKRTILFCWNMLKVFCEVEVCSHQTKCMSTATRSSRKYAFIHGFVGYLFCSKKWGLYPCLAKSHPTITTPPTLSIMDVEQHASTTFTCLWLTFLSCNSCMSYTYTARTRPLGWLYNQTLSHAHTVGKSATS